MLGPRGYIVIVKAIEIILEAYSDRIVGVGFSKPTRHVDGWTVATFFTSLVLGFLFPHQIYFMFYVAVVAQLVAHFTGADNGAILSHVLIKIMGSILGYAAGSLLRVGKLNIKL
jgi:hypothetical protein